MALIDTLKQKDKFTPAENQIAEYILNSSKTLVDMSLEELADTIYVSKSTIIRFCKKLGFKGHHELCVALAKEINTFSSSDYVIDQMTPFQSSDDPVTVADKVLAMDYYGVTETYHRIDIPRLMKTARIINEKKSLTLYAMDFGVPYAQYFSQRLSFIGFDSRVSAIGQYGAGSASMQAPGSAALFISYQGDQRILINAASVLREKHIPIILITGTPECELGRYADEVILIPVQEQQSRAASYGSGMGLMLTLDVLYAEVFFLDFDKNEKTLTANEEIRKRLSE